MNHPSVYRISAAARQQAGERTLGVLAALLPIRFMSGEAANTRAAAEIRLEASHDAQGHGADEAGPVFVAARDRSAPGDAQTAELDVLFADDPALPFPFRGARLRTRVPASWKPLPMRSGDRALATSDGSVLWSVCGSRPGSHRFRSAFPLPRLSEGQGFADVFNGECFLQTLPLLQFLRETSASAALHNAPLRAAFIVDDPNLHWPRYGFVDYRVMAEHAARENYHVSFAMIPMDTWFTHRPTAALLRDCRERLSLVVHGNNHARNELARDYDDATRIAMLDQAIRRMERFETRSELRVDRVMVPPHGACSARMLAALPRAGFEAVCLSTGSLRAHNPGEAWTSTAGYAPSEVVGGCPVLPRWGLTGSVRNNMLVAAYLGQALILRGHHQDLKHGLDVFDEFARMINAIGPVQWSNMSGVCRQNHQWRMEGSTCHLLTFGRSLSVDLPAGATRLRLEDTGSHALTEHAWRVRTSDGIVHTLAQGETLDIGGQPSTRLSIDRPITRQHPPAQRPPRTATGLILRRLLTEARDRLLVG